MTTDDPTPLVWTPLIKDEDPGLEISGCRLVQWDDTGRAPTRPISSNSHRRRRATPNRPRWISGCQRSTRSPHIQRILPPMAAAITTVAATTVAVAITRPTRARRAHQTRANTARILYFSRTGTVAARRCLLSCGRCCLLGMAVFGVVEIVELFHRPHLVRPTRTWARGPALSGLALGLNPQLLKDTYLRNRPQRASSSRPRSAAKARAQPELRSAQQAQGDP